jgi:hypothetical protein
MSIELVQIDGGHFHYVCAEQQITVSWRASPILSLRASTLLSLRAEGVAISAWQPRLPSTEIATSLPLLAMTLAKGVTNALDKYQPLNLVAKISKLKELSRARQLKRTTKEQNLW